MSTRAKKLGSLGVIIDGQMRDIQEHKDLDFPVSYAQKQLGLGETKL